MFSQNFYCCNKKLFMNSKEKNFSCFLATMCAKGCEVVQPGIVKLNF